MKLLLCTCLVTAGCCLACSVTDRCWMRAGMQVMSADLAAGSKLYADRAKALYRQVAPPLCRID